MPTLDIPAPFQKPLKEAAKRGLDSTRFVFEHIFTDGLSHNTALVNDQGSRYVIKVFGESAQLRYQAIEGQKIAAQLNLAPEILFLDADIGILLCEYLPSESLAHAPISSAEIVAIAQSLRALHFTPHDSLTHTLGLFDMAKFCEQYVTSAGEWGTREHANLTPIINTFQGQQNGVFCHNDLVAANIFIHNKNAVFIDWEYAQINNPFFDLAAVVFYLQLHDQQRDFFLKSYFERPASAQDLSNLETSTAVLLWGDVLWHLHTFGLTFAPKLKHKLDWLLNHNYITSLP